jgi:hypothetical protein
MKKVNGSRTFCPTDKVTGMDRSEPYREKMPAKKSKFHRRRVVLWCHKVYVQILRRNPTERTCEIGWYPDVGSTEYMTTTTAELNLRPLTARERGQGNRRVVLAKSRAPRR